MWSGIEWVLWQGQRVLLVGYLGRVLHQAWSVSRQVYLWRPTDGSVWGLGCLLCEREEPWAEVVRHEECDLIPATNNAVEMVIQRFDQHDQNFCGFESIQTAQPYLGVFEKVYRSTPFSRDARPEIRGKSPCS